MDRDPDFHELLMRRGRVKQIAEAAGVSTQAVSQWKRIPPEHVHAIAEALSMQPWQLRPDLWKPPQEDAA